MIGEDIHHVAAMSRRSVRYYTPIIFFNKRAKKQADLHDPPTLTLPAAAREGGARFPLKP